MSAAVSLSALSFDRFSSATFLLDSTHDVNTAPAISPPLSSLIPSPRLSPTSYRGLSPVPYDWLLTLPASPHRTSTDSSPTSISPPSTAQLPLSAAPLLVSTTAPQSIDTIQPPIIVSKTERDGAEEVKRGKKRVPAAALLKSDSEEQSGKEDGDGVVVDRSSSGMPSRRRLSEAQVRRRRRRQRQADLQRRYREQRSLAQLQQLMAPNTCIDPNQHVNDEEGEDGKLRTRADLLEESVQQIAQLQLLVAQLTSTCNELQYRTNCCAPPPTERSLPALATPSTSLLRHLPPSASAFLANHVRRLSLHSSMLVHSPVAVTMVHRPSGLIADASESMLQHTGWQRSQLVGRRMLPPLQTMLSDPMLLTNPHIEIMRDNRTLVAGEGGRVVSSKQEPQYESSLRLAHQLVTGAKDIIVAVWRGQFADGKVQHTLHHEA